MGQEDKKEEGNAEQTVGDVFGVADSNEEAAPVTPAQDPIQHAQSVKEQSAQKVRTAASRPDQEPTHLIKLHNNPEIPPGGQYVGVNGRWIKIVPNVEMEVPESALEVLDNAVRLEPEKDEHNRVIGTREVPRFPYSFVRRPRRPATEA